MTIFFWNNYVEINTNAWFIIIIIIISSLSAAAAQQRLLLQCYLFRYQFS